MTLDNSTMKASLFKKPLVFKYICNLNVNYKNNNHYYI